MKSFRRFLPYATAFALFFTVATPAAFASGNDHVGTAKAKEATRVVQTERTFQVDRTTQAQRDWQVDRTTQAQRDWQVDRTTQAQRDWQVDRTTQTQRDWQVHRTVPAKRAFHITPAKRAASIDGTAQGKGTFNLAFKNPGQKAKGKWTINIAKKPYKPALYQHTSKRVIGNEYYHFASTKQLSPGKYTVYGGFHGTVDGKKTSTGVVFKILVTKDHKVKRIN
ncbi:hypothetical protein SAMN05444487_12018 [Marininema mesophilum]|uniref:Uncharacterized protein n=1 Tax=Marininema mesophilum TaxID=1048340 RepID=A0A1H3C5G3_9BACL|nr:hypothetical protein [Marininema mesophilum]SDX49393.1 hypothetical protein SAMN05444487_12018 [Marininema mesophilum]